MMRGVSDADNHGRTLPNRRIVYFSESAFGYVEHAGLRSRGHGGGGMRRSRWVAVGGAGVVVAMRARVARGGAWLGGSCRYGLR